MAGGSLTEAFTLRERQFTSVRVKSEGRKYDFGSSITLDKKIKITTNIEVGN